jgi:hypothetical protein
VEALEQGVHVHGPGKWQIILDDAEFRNILDLRTAVQLKDKWRNMHK